VRGGEAGAVTADRTPQGAVAVMAASRTLSHSKLGGGASPRGGKGAHGTTGRPPEETRTLTGLPEENSTTSLLKFFVPLQSTMIFMHTLKPRKNISQKLLAICLPPNINLAMNPEAPNQRFSPGGGGDARGARVMADTKALYSIRLSGGRGLSAPYLHLAIGVLQANGI